MMNINKLTFYLLQILMFYYRLKSIHYYAILHRIKHLFGLLFDLEKNSPIYTKNNTIYILK